MIYFLYSLRKVHDAHELIGIFQIRGEDKLVQYFRVMAGCKFIQMVCVEMCGLILLFCSTSATDVVNSSATLFLAEVDDIFIELLLGAYESKSKFARTIEFGGMEIEFDPAESSKKETMKETVKDTKDLLTEGGQSEKSTSSTSSAKGEWTSMQFEIVHVIGSVRR